MLNRDEAVLVFVDVQGRLHEIMHDKETLDANLERVVRCAQLLEVPVIGTEQIPEKLGPTCEPFRALLAAVPMIPKSAFSCCGEPEFMNTLRANGRKQVILCGIEAHVCIYQTAMDLLAEEIEVIVAADAVSSRSVENRELALQAMRAAGAQVLPTETILFALLRDAVDPSFKQLLQLVK